jgi:hypothetical protein
MRRVSDVFLALGFLLFTSSPLSAATEWDWLEGHVWEDLSEEQKAEILSIDCGSIDNRNVSYQVGSYTNMEYVVETARDLNLCPIAVAVDGWVAGVPNSAGHKSDLFTASLRKPVAVPDYGIYTTKADHWRIYVLTFWFKNGHTSSQCDVKYQGGESEGDPPPSDGDEAPGVAPGDPSCNGCVSPIIIDTARNGYKLTNVANGVQFDLDADGVPEQVAWTRQDSDEAFLAMDRNGNGRVDDGSELFGNYTPAFPDMQDVTTANGFEALKFLETPSYGRSAADGIIEKRDAAYQRLLIWRDSNHNGISEPDELQRAAAAGIVAIHTDYKTKKRVDTHGNQFRQRGTIIWIDGSDYCFDIWLKGLF